MNSIWLSLLWKEWCEQRWKLVALATMLAIVPAITIVLFGVGKIDKGEAIELLVAFPTVFLFIYVVLAGIFVGMSVAGGENSRGTMRFLQSLPTPMWQAALTKLSVAMLVVSLPIVVLMGITYLFGAFVDADQELWRRAARHLPPMERSWGITNWYAARAVTGVVGVCSLLVWTAACGLNRSDEVRAGAVALLVISAIWGCAVYAWELASRYSLASVQSVLEIFKVMLPVGPAVPSLRAGNNYALEIVLAGTAHLAVTVWFMRRFGTVVATRHGGQGLQLSDLFRYQTGSAPRRTRLGAIAWKQLRETGPLAACAVIAVLAIVIGIHFAHSDFQRTDELGALLGGVGMSVGILVALISGVGALLEDYRPGVNNFWRSRPINVHIWFFVKYLTGLVVLTAAFGSVLLLANGLSDWRLASYDDAAFVGLVFLGGYSLSVCCYALVRQPIYAVILAVGTPYLVLVCCGVAFGLLGWTASTSVAIAATLVGIGLTVVLAWQAVVRDWGWKQHR